MTFHSCQRQFHYRKFHKRQYFTATKCQITVSEVLLKSLQYSYGNTVRSIEFVITYSFKAKEKLFANNVTIPKKNLVISLFIIQYQTPLSIQPTENTPS